MIEIQFFESLLFKVWPLIMIEVEQGKYQKDVRTFQRRKESFCLWQKYWTIF